ncbi:MAG: A/G-specific adenine glycosylase [Parcubacteria group bacterium]|nr:A/G-specific adenine glycosylase [Parcubacteria group bacterium]
MLAALAVRAFRVTVYGHYAQHARSFPWRATRDPYRILVSEIMLQQTQADRVAEKYPTFIKRFPTVRSLAAARLASVLRAWQGLGYNRRAKLLHEAARTIAKEHAGRVPRDSSALRKLPGVGAYTASAVAAFAFNQPVAMIETNIRSVYLHRFFANKKGVDDKQLVPLIEQTLDAGNPRKWYAALMDYGSYLKRTLPNPSRRSSRHTKQAPFVGSNRQLRGAIIRLLLEKPNQPFPSLARQLHADVASVQKNLEQMRKEGLLKKQGSGFVAG